MATEIRAKYKCTEVELYAIAELLFNNLRADLARFVLKKAKYTTLFVDGLELLRTDAMALPDEEQRNGVHQVLKNQLPDLVNAVKDNFNDLKGYIRDAWPDEDPKPRYEAAGLVKYNAIGENNWENVAGLNEAMAQFIGDNTATLTTPGGMPATFPTKVTDDTTAFNDVYGPFLTSRETATATAAKLAANNTLHDAMMDVCKDGVEMVFRNDAEGQKRYTFTALKTIVSPPGSASLKVIVKNGADVLQPGKTVRIKKEGSPAITAITNEEGVALFENADPGVYEGEVDTGSGTVPFTKEVNTGTDARITVVI
jgi:hypothetical protein